MITRLGQFFKRLYLAQTIIMFDSPGTVLDKKKINAKYPEARVIVLDDSFNTLILFNMSQIVF